MKAVRFFSTLVVGCAMALGSAYAHDDAYLDTQKAPHGGQLRMAGIYHFELVVAKAGPESKANPVVVYLTDHAGQKIAAAGASGTATLLTGKEKTVVTLSPDADNGLKGVGKYAAVPGLKVVVSIALPGKAAEQARFTPLAAKVDGHMDQ
jgi:hypothetical protein